MYWLLLLAHFIGDYPLQPSWMVRAKRNLGMLLLHIGVHLAILLALVGFARGPQWPFLWPYLALLAGAHFLIDIAKNAIWAIRPDWMSGPYVIDQFLHYLSIAWIASLMEANTGLPAFTAEPAWAVYVTAFLVSTYVWFISERIFAHADPEYRREVNTMARPRMLVRAGLLALILVTGNLVVPAAASLALIVPLPYRANKFALRALLIDLAVAGVTGAIVLLVR